MRENVLALQMVTARPPDACRPPLAQVERGLRPGEADGRLRGNLGVITEITLRLYGIPDRSARRPARSTTSKAQSAP